MKPELESVIIALTIQPRRNGIDFFVMQTPLPLWEALPQKAEFIEADYTNNAHYFKRFVLKMRGKFYEFTFYRTEKKS